MVPANILSLFWPKTSYIKKCKICTGFQQKVRLFKINRYIYRYICPFFWQNFWKSRKQYICPYILLSKTKFLKIISENSIYAHQYICPYNTVSILYLLLSIRARKKYNIQPICKVICGPPFTSHSNGSNWLGKHNAVNTPKISDRTVFVELVCVEVVYLPQKCLSPLKLSETCPDGSKTSGNG